MNIRSRPSRLKILHSLILSLSLISMPQFAAAQEHGGRGGGGRGSSEGGSRSSGGGGGSRSFSQGRGSSGSGANPASRPSFGGSDRSGGGSVRPSFSPRPSSESQTRPSARPVQGSGSEGFGGRSSGNSFNAGSGQSVRRPDFGGSQGIERPQSSRPSGSSDRVGGQGNRPANQARPEGPGVSRDIVRPNFERPPTAPRPGGSESGAATRPNFPRPSSDGTTNLRPGGNRPEGVTRPERPGQESGAIGGSAPRPGNRPGTEGRPSQGGRPVVDARPDAGGMAPENTVRPGEGQRPVIGGSNRHDRGPGAGRPGGGRPEGGRPEGGRPEGGRPEGGRPEGGRPEGGRPGDHRPGGGRPNDHDHGVGGGRPGGGMSNRPSWDRPSWGTGSHNHSNWGWNSHHHHGWNSSWVHNGVNPHYHWYRNPWRGHWGSGFYSPIYWGGAGWGLGVYTGGWGGGYSYYNPYYVDVIPTYAVYNYAQPIVVTTYIDDSQGGVAQPGQGVQAIDQALEEFRRANYAGSVPLFDQAVQEMPGDAVAHELRALALFAIGDYQSAAAILNSLLTSAPGMDWTTMSGLYGNVADYTTQLRSLENHCRNNRKDSAAFFVLAYHYLVIGNEDVAARMLKVVVENEPRDVTAKRMLDALESGDAADETSAIPPAPSGDLQPATTSASSGELMAPDLPGIELPSETPVPSAVETPPTGDTVQTTDLVGKWQAKPEGAVIDLTIGEDSQFKWVASPQGQPTVTVEGKMGFTDAAVQFDSEKEGAMAGQVISQGPDRWTFKLTEAPASDPGLIFERVK